MEFQICVMPGDWLLVELLGEITAPERNQMIKEVKSTCDKHGIRKVLFDLNQSEAKTSYVDDFNFGSYLSKYMKGIHIASVSSNYGRLSFVTEVVTVRGHTTRIFHTREEGLKWLGVDA